MTKMRHQQVMHDGTCMLPYCWTQRVATPGHHCDTLSQLLSGIPPPV